MATQDERSIGEVLQDAANNIAEIVRSEVRLAKVEMNEASVKAVVSMRPLVAGATLAFWGVGFFLLTIMFALAIVFPLWFAALIVWLLAMMIGGLMMLRGLQRFRRLNPVFERTAANVKEQVQWLKQHVT